MNKKLKSVMSMLVVMILVLSVFAGCSNSDKEASSPSISPASTASASTEPASVEATPAEATPVAANETNDINAHPWIDNPDADTSDLPTWTGKQLKLTYWQAEGTGGLGKKKSANDVVTPEVQRVTGVTIDEDNSIDNGGQSWDIKLSQLTAANDYPDMVWNAQDLKKLVDANKLYDLTELIPKYAPNLQKMYDTFLKPTEMYKKYSLPFGIYENLYADTDHDPSVDLAKYSVFNPPVDSLGYIWVRDDVIKKLYPSAKSEKEIQDMYVQKGAFTKEEILDVPINSSDDFIKMLYNIKDLQLKEGNKPVSPFFVSTGTDNWPLMAVMMAILEGRMDTDYYTYFNKKDQKLAYLFKQPAFREDVKLMNKLVIDGVASKEGLLDPNEVFNEKLKNGLYAVTYAWMTPDNAGLEAAGKPYKYRKVYLNIPQKTDEFLRYKSNVGSRSGLYIFKDSVAPEDLPQILRWYDYMVSQSAEKLRSWGPKSAGLFDEVSGSRVFKDKELADNMVYQTQNGKALQYNLGDSTTITAPTGGLMVTFMNQNKSKFHPAVTYDRSVRTPAGADQAFSIGFTDPAQKVLANSPNIWVFGEVPSLQKAFAAKKALEDPLTKTLTAGSAAQFDKLYDDFLKSADKAGFTDAALAEGDKYFREHNVGGDGVDYMPNIK
ncbi:hypothetical protein EHS13_27590 [Paenibacillus psychroresistens]|uniref:Extracellular solute-binding protein n=1 Tax=Paenibacillus psychroresistens TaxID=1778678 RepID=A0A6B8RPT0_9BACL|nr:hypothetical protein [Paenibacillus psychroresistens]QGQ98381.1 hypothetical protein EHS13_27590 [Paenibacillus psychroresistens]